MCATVFSNQARMRAHVNHLHGVDEINCSRCDLRFSDIQEYKEHMKRDHTTAGIVAWSRCDWCKDFYQSKEKLETQMLNFT